MTLLQGRLLGATAIGLALSATAAVAQPAPGAPQVQEVIVTAQKREQALNDVGMSINAISGEALTNLGVTTTADLTRVVPAFSVTPPNTGLSGAPVYTMRGIGFNARSLSALSAVSVYVDEVPLPYTYMTAGPLVDIARVEVLKGPQGTLYGQNSTGGAINYIANKPTDIFSAGFDASYGRFDELDVSGHVSGPLTDTLAGRLALRSITSDGWQKSITRPGDRFGGQDKVAGRLLLEWSPLETLNVTLNANGWIDRSDTIAFQIVGINPADPLGGGVAFPCFEGLPPGCPALGGAQYTFYDELLNFPRPPDSIRAADRDVSAGGGLDFKNHNDFAQGSLRADWQVAPGTTLTSITAYSRLTQRSNHDIDGTPYRIANFFTSGNIRSLNQEVRLAGEWGDALTWIVGGNYSNDLIRAYDRNFAAGTSLGQAFGLDSTATIAKSDRTGWAVFASGDYALTNQLTLTGGLRYTEVELDYNGCSADVGDGRVAAIFAGTAGPGQCITYLDVTSTIPNQGLVQTRFQEDNVSWRIGLNWKPTPDHLIYGNISRGYKSGDIPTVIALTESQLQPVEQEELTAYEVGVKSTLLEGRLQANAAVFHYDYKNKQLQGYISTFLGLAESTVNIPDSEVNGAEVELTALPIEGLTLRAGVGYTKTEVGDYVTFGANTSPIWPPPAGFNVQPVVDVSGDPFNLAPKWQANFDGQYDWALANGLEAFVGASAAYASSTLPVLAAAEALRIESHTTLDLRAGVQSPDEGWRVMVWGRNVTNENYAITTFRSFENSGRYPALPATWGVTLSYDLAP